MNAGGDGTESPPYKRRPPGRPSGAVNTKDWTGTIAEGANRSTRSKAINANSNEVGRVLSDITPNVGEEQSKRKRAAKSVSFPASSHHPKQVVTNDTDRTVDTPLAPRNLENNLLVPCEGIAHGFDAKTMTLFLGAALKTKGEELIESARGNSDLITVDGTL
jgi:hypothetical protein